MTDREAAVFCRSLLRKSNTHFQAAFILLPRPQREAIQTVYAFCRYADDLVDQPTSDGHPPHEARVALDWLRMELERCYAGEATHPLTRQLAKVIVQMHLSKVHFEELLNGIEMDLTQTRYQTMDDLSTYCYRVASTVGLLCIEIFGCQRPETQQHAIAQGTALQLTNILRDIQVDAERGRIYLPLEDLKAFGYTETDLMSSRYTPAFVNLMAFECQRARAWYAKAREYLTPEDRPRLLASETMAMIYTRLLEEIEARRYDVFSRPITLSKPRRFGIALRLWLTDMWRSHAT